MKSFSIQEALGYGIRTLWKHMLSLVGFALIIVGIQIGFTVLYGILLKLLFQLTVIPFGVDNTLKVLGTMPGGPGPNIVLFSMVLIGAVINIFLQVWGWAAWLNVGLKLYDEDKASTHDLFSFSLLLPHIISISVVICIVGILGFVAFIIPGIYWIIRSIFSIISLLDDPKQEGLDPIRTSFALTKGNFWRLICFFIVLFFFGLAVMVGGLALVSACRLFFTPLAQLICVCGTFPVALFLFWALMPIVMLAKVYVYRQLKPVKL